MMTRLVTMVWVVSGVCAGLLSAGGGPSSQPQAQDVLRKLLKQGPPIIAPAKVKEPARQAVPRRDRSFRPPLTAGRGQKPPGQKLLPEGYYVADRRGRLVRTGDQWIYTFESDGKALADPPMTLLPNGWLEKMESDVTASAASLVFRVSGEVTYYHGRNYLLLRKVLVERRPGPNYQK